MAGTKAGAALARSLWPRRRAAVVVAVDPLPATNGWTVTVEIDDGRRRGLSARDVADGVDLARLTVGARVVTENSTRMRRIVEVVGEGAEGRAT